MTVSLSEESEVERILRDLQGTDATHGRAGVLVVDRSNLRLQVGSGTPFPTTFRPCSSLQPSSRKGCDGPCRRRKRKHKASALIARPGSLKLPCCTNQCNPPHFWVVS